MSPLKSFRTRFFALGERYIQTDVAYLASSGFWINLQVSVTALFSFVLSIVFANLLSAETYGTYQYLISLGTVITAFTLTGMNYSVTQAVARGHEGTLRASVALQLKWSVLPFLIGCGAATYYFLAGNMILVAGMIIIALLTPLANAFNTYAAYLHGKQAFRQAFFYGTILNLAYYGSIIAAAFYFQGALALLFVNLAINAIVAVCLYVATLRRYKPNEAVDAEALTHGRTLSYLFVLTHIARQADALLIFHFLGPVVLAAYSFASAIPERLAGFFKSIFTAALPRFSVQKAASIRTSLVRKMVITSIVGLVVAGTYIIFAPFIFTILFPRYMEAVPYSQVYALIILMVGSNLSLSALLSQRFKRELYFFYTVTPILLIVLQVALLLLYGLWGIIFARLISSAIELVLSVRLFYRQSIAPAS